MPKLLFIETVIISAYAHISCLLFVISVGSFPVAARGYVQSAETLKPWLQYLGEQLIIAAS